MADSWSVPIVGSVIDSGNDQIAKGADLSWIGKLPDAYWQGKDQAYQQNQREVFSKGLPTIDPNDPKSGIDWTKVSNDLARVGGAGQAQNLIGLQNVALGRDYLDQAAKSGIFPSASSSAPSTSALPPSGSPAMPNAERVQPSGGQLQSPADVPTGTPAPPGQNITGPNTTVTGIDYGQAPSNGGNITARMLADRTGGNAGQIANALGVSPDEVINTNDPNVRTKLAQVVRSGAQPSAQPGAQPIAPSAPAQAPAAPMPAAPAPAAGPQGNITEARAQDFETRAGNAFRLATGVSISNPQAGARLQAAGEALMKQATTIREALAKNAEVTPETKNYQQAVAQGYKGSQAQFQAESAGQVEEAKKQVESLGKLADAGIEAKGKIGQLNAVQQLGEKVGYGVVPKIQSFLGAHGIDTTGLSDIQAYERAIDFMAPQLRPIGSGRLMQQELTAFKSSLGGLMTTPEGRRISIANLKLINTYSDKVGSIASDTSLSPSQRYEKIYSLDPPKLNLNVPKGGGGAAPAAQTFTGPTGRTYKVINGQLVP